MANRVISFAVGQQLAANEGVDERRASELGLLASVLDGVGYSNLMSILAVQQIARGEAQSLTPAPAPPGPGPAPEPVPDTVIVPDVRGTTVSQAQGVLRQIDPELTAAASTSPDLSTVVIGQVPAPGSRVTLPFEISLFTPEANTDDGLIEVPSLVGRSLRQSVEVLEERSLKGLALQKDSNFPLPRGSSDDLDVLEQSPSAGSRIRANDRVLLVVPAQVVIGATPGPD